MIQPYWAYSWEKVLFELSSELSLYSAQGNTTYTQTSLSNTIPNNHIKYVVSFRGITTTNDERNHSSLYWTPSYTKPPISNSYTCTCIIASPKSFIKALFKVLKILLSVFETDLQNCDTTYSHSGIKPNVNSKTFEVVPIHTIHWQAIIPLILQLLIP